MKNKPTKVYLTYGYTYLKISLTINYVKEHIMLSFFAQTDAAYPSGLDSGAAAGAAGASSVFILLAIAYVVLAVAGMWKVFEKAGRPGWAAIVPFYNLYVLLQIAGKPTWWLAVMLLGGLIPVVGLIVVLVMQVLIGVAVAQKFGKDTVYGAVLCGLLGIGYLLLGFGSATYNGAVAAPSAPTTPTTPPTV